MKNKFTQIPVAASLGILFFLLANPSGAQISQSACSAKTSHESTSFTKVIDSKIDRNDTEIIRSLFENSSHAEMLKSYSKNTLYIMDLDQFKDGMANFEVFGKEVKVLTKYELLDMVIPFYITIDGFNKKGTSCEAVVTIHEMNEEGKVSPSETIKLSQSAQTWENQN